MRTLLVVALLALLATAVNGECNVSEWSPWSTCHAPSSGTGCAQDRVRSVVTLPVPTDDSCPSLSESQDCSPDSCPIDCVVSSWSPWSPCSVSCGGGFQIRQLTVQKQPNALGLPCPASLNETSACNTEDCPTPYIMTDNGDMHIYVPPGNDVYFEFGTDEPFTLDDLKSEVEQYTVTAVQALNANIQPVIAATSTNAYIDTRTYADSKISTIYKQISAETAANLTASLATTSTAARTYTDTSVNTLSTSVSTRIASVSLAVSTANSQMAFTSSAASSVTAGLSATIAAQSNAVASQSTSVHNSISSLTSLKADVTTTTGLQNQITNLGTMKADATQIPPLSTSVQAVSSSVTALEASVSVSNVNLNFLSSNFTAFRSLFVPAIGSVSLAAAGAYMTVSWTLSVNPPIPTTYYLEFNFNGGAFERVATNPSSPYTWLPNNGTAYGKTISFRVIGSNNAGTVSLASSNVLLPIRMPQGKVYTCFGASNGATWSWSSSGGTVVEVCRVTFTLAERSVVHAAGTGHAYTNGWTWGGISINSDNDVPGNVQEYNGGYTESTSWLNFRHHRTKMMPAGSVTVTLLFRGSSNGYYNGQALHVISIIAPDLATTNTFKCTPAAWSNQFSAGVGNVVCRTSFTLVNASLVWAHFNAHTYVANNWVYQAVTFDGDADGNLDRQDTANGHTYSTRWVSIDHARGTVLAPGSHTAGINIWATASTGQQNGAAMNGFFFPTQGVIGRLYCAPSSWSIAAGGSWVTDCTASVSLPVSAHIWLEFTGHSQASSNSWCYGSPYINSGDPGPVPFDWGNAHAYPPGYWNTFGAMRTFSVSSGTTTVGFWHRCGTTGWINGHSLHGFWIAQAP
eukprot:m.349447 g.349447  ORF g.349447 m.349447 type:complete len:856 (+) comp55883_c0_seq1:287-2854(+)